MPTNKPQDVQRERWKINVEFESYDEPSNPRSVRLELTGECSSQNCNKLTSERVGALNYMASDMGAVLRYFGDYVLPGTSDGPEQCAKAFLEKLRGEE